MTVMGDEEARDGSKVKVVHRDRATAPSPPLLTARRCWDTVAYIFKIVRMGVMGVEEARGGRCL